MSSYATTTSSTLVAFLQPSGHRKLREDDTLVLDLDSLTFDDTTDGSPVLFNQGLTVAAAHALTGLGALTLGVAAGAFDLTVQLGDAAGAQKLSIVDSASSEVARIDSDGNSQFDGNMVIDGDLTVNGTTTTVDSETVLIADNYMQLNSGYTTDAAQTGGFTVRYDPTATTSAVAGAAFTATTVEVASGTGFATGQIIAVDDANTGDNLGLFEVASVATNTITIDTTPTEDFSGTGFTADATIAGTVTVVNVAVMRADTSGDFEVGKGSTVPISYSALSTGAASPWTTDTNVVNLVTDGDTVTIGSATAGGKLFVDADADELQLQVDGFTTQTGAVARFEHFAVASSAPVLELQLDAAAFTGAARGLQVDFANATSITNGADVYGVEMLGETNLGAGDSVGIFLDSAWDFGMKVDNAAGINFFDDRELSFGTGYDAYYEWDTATVATDHLRLTVDLYHIASNEISVDPGNNARTSGEAFSVGDVLAVSSVDNKLYPADADHATPSRQRPVGVALIAATGADEVIMYASIDGTVCVVNTNLTGASVGDRVYVDATTAGGLTTTPPVTGEVWQVGLVFDDAAAGSAEVQLRVQHVIDN